MKSLPVIAHSKGFEEIRDFLLWCREMRIPILQCEVYVRTTLEPIPHKIKGSKRMVSLYSELTQRNPPRTLEIKSAFLIREIDYALVAIRHGNISLGWRVFVEQAIYGNDAFVS